MPPENRSVVRRNFRQRLLAVVALVALAGSLATAIPPQTASAQAPTIGQTPDFTPRKAYFPETQHHLSGEMLKTWLNNGDFTIYGFPITDPVSENGRIVQYFERARLELWPENAEKHPDWVVQGTLLGIWKAQEVRDRRPFLPVVLEGYEPNEDFYYFEETSHTLANGFKKYWDENGGVAVFGFPISEEFEEGGYNVQYFERARLEWHPENAGTEYEVLLGHLGREYAESRRVDTKGFDRAGDAVEFDPGLFDARWGDALANGEDGRWAFVETDVLNVRSEPNTNAEIVDVVYRRRPLQLTELVAGEPVKGVAGWYSLDTGGYVPAVFVDPLIVPAPPQVYAGAWIDVNLSEFWAIAYVGDTPRYVAIITAGRGDRTPKGVFSVQYRVENETMDSATVGFPPGHPEYYYLENVKYTQYFLAGGFAVHGNYWTPESAFGQFSSNGCVGLMNTDALDFWNHLGVGSVVSIHF
ncbi:MAG: L,D-transpeptidase family protein [Thermomicrobiales bacterium]